MAQSGNTTTKMDPEQRKFQRQQLGVQARETQWQNRINIIPGGKLAAMAQQQMPLVGNLQVQMAQERRKKFAEAGLMDFGDVTTMTRGPYSKKKSSLF